MEESDSAVYSIKTIKQIDEEEFEAVFEFDAETEDGLRQTDQTKFFNVSLKLF